MLSRVYVGGVVLRGLHDALLVGAGGFLGAIMRWALSGFVQRLASAGTFPHGTLVVNVVGCLVLGLLAGLGDARQAFGPELRLFLFLGLLGGFTTFSTFGHETMAFVRDGQNIQAAGNVLLQLGLGLGAAWLGYTLGAR